MSELTKILDQLCQPAVLLQDGVVRYANPPARRLGLMPEQQPAQLRRPDGLSDEGPVQIACEFAGKRCTASISSCGEGTLCLIETPSGPAGSYPGTTLAHTADSIRRTLHDLHSSVFSLSSAAAEQEDSRMLRYAAQLLQGIHRLDRTATQLDMLQKLETGSYQPQLERIDLGVFCSTLLSEAKDLLRYAELSLQYTVPSPGTIGCTDRRLLSFALWNLLSNAAAHTADGSVTVSVCRRDCAVLEVCVGSRVDTPPAADRIFQRHTASMEDSLSQSGPGVGLALTRAITELLGGRLMLSEGPGDLLQAIFTVELTTADDRPLSGPANQVQDGLNPALVALSDVLPADAFDTRDLL